MTGDRGSRFRIPDRLPSKPPDLEVLFRGLSGRSPNVEYLWSHQADVLREWFSRHQHTKDLALELPTGTGKTLVGLLLGEFRRQTFGERVAYLCPTRQLAHQVGNLAHLYDIPVKVLVGRQADYAAADYSAYASASAIAVTTHAAIFNTSPRIDDANALIVDDAHAAESFIASLWCVEVDRFQHRATYFSLVEFFQDALPSWLLWNLRNDNDFKARGTSDKVPSPVFAERLEALRDFLDSSLTGDLRYAWTMIRANLAACHMFLSWPTISIRPVIPPAMTHAAFASANQRIYMSATLGEGGELERITRGKADSQIACPGGLGAPGNRPAICVVPWSLPTSRSSRPSRSREY